MARDTLLPLADLSRLPLLLCVHAEARAGRISYKRPLRPLFGGPAAGAGSAEPQLRHALAHTALAPPGEGSTARAGLAKSSLGDLRSGATMRQRLLAALAPAPAVEGHAAYLPLGAGYAAAAAVEASRGAGSLRAALQQLSGAAECGERELALGLHGGTAPAATLSSVIFSDIRTLLGGGGQGRPGGGAGQTFLGVLGSTADVAGQAARYGPPPSAMPAAAGGGIRSMATSILDTAGGLLVDPALAGGAVFAASPDAAGGAGAENLCPDLAAVSSARALAAVLAAAEPVAEASPIIGRERLQGSGGMAALLSVSTPRAWDERGFEVFESEGTEPSSAPAAVGLTAAGGLLGAAVQWRQGSGARPAVTAVVLTNELSLAAVPARLVTEVSSALGLGQLATFSG
uniref:Uncharacterized protein n=1 Tax=Pyrodinium bahamense TaxID=73915 RepID=A0A7S0G0E0_9DINO